MVVALVYALVQSAGKLMDDADKRDEDIRHNGRMYWSGPLVLAFVLASAFTSSAQPTHGTLTVCLEQDSLMRRFQEADVMVMGEMYWRIQHTDRRGCASFTEMPLGQHGNLAYVYVLAQQWQNIVPVLVTSDQVLMVSQPAWHGWWFGR
jgi:hypothetical protein